MVYAVTTTGIYCRMTCSAKRPRPENVRHFATPVAAEAAGFRACKRCSPNGASLTERYAAKIAEVCEFIAAAETPPSLREMAKRAGLSSHHFHRIFKAVVGVTPKQYTSAHRAQRVREELARSSSVTGAIYAAGYNSSGRFYADDALGMTASTYRRGGRGETLWVARGECSLGPIVVARSERGVCAILLGEDDLPARFPNATFVPDDDEALRNAIQMVDTPGTNVDLPLDIRGTTFQQRVWQALRSIPVGKTASYTEIAAEIGAPKSVRAVAGACAANSLAVAIPCHRVVRSDGGLAGYRWGVERKRALLNLERKQ